MKLPKSIKIKGEVWKIKLVDNLHAPDGDKVQGYCFTTGREIYIDKSLRGEQLSITYLHEINHAIMFELHLTLNLEVEEIIADGFASVYEKLFF